ncbi:hypothetical protein OLMES_0212 [Oleiphilus messinensis]|uniref:Lipoprotein n=1 Tax=Oleiphilus messinensis TaxID=141451 RepID=A0A1Y0I281_9GAMM|nr:hypothetical protein [Oleiphilus messinensis]ARU54319.1 hypothetical protein OLMES_0212 [Oleiphilus messinensis]
MHRFALAFVLFLISACTTQVSVDLRHLPLEGAEQIYLSLNKRYSIDKDTFTPLADLACGNESLDAYREIADFLKSLKFKETNSITKLRHVGDDLEVQVVSKYQVIPNSSYVQGNLLLHSIVDSKGKIKSFYLQRGQRNTVSLLFDLPYTRVKVGDCWDVPVSLINTKIDYDVTDYHQRNEAVLLSKRTLDSGDILVEVMMNLDESVSGNTGRYYVQNSNEILLPFSLIKKYIALGEFNVSKGYWERYIGYLVTDGGGILEMEDSTQIFLLKPLAIETK